MLLHSWIFVFNKNLSLIAFHRTIKTKTNKLVLRVLVIMICSSSQIVLCALCVYVCVCVCVDKTQYSSYGQFLLCFFVCLVPNHYVRFSQQKSNCKHRLLSHLVVGNIYFVLYVCSSTAWETRKKKTSPVSRIPDVSFVGDNVCYISMLLFLIFVVCFISVYFLQMLLVLILVVQVKLQVSESL